MKRSTPWIIVYVSKMPPHDAQAPIEMHHLGSGICSQILRRTGIIFSEIRPETIIRSLWRGENRITSAPKRARSYREASVAMSSIAQQAVPKGIGQRLDLRAQLTTFSREVVRTP